MMGIRLEKPDHPHQDDGQNEKSRCSDMIEQYLRITKAALGADTAVWIGITEKLPLAERGIIRLEDEVIHDKGEKSGAEEMALIQSVAEVTLDQNRLVIPIPCDDGSTGAGVVYGRRSGVWTASDLGLGEDVRAIAKQIIHGLVLQQDLKKHESSLFQKSGLITLGQISAEIVHEINNPLAALHAGLSLLRIRADSSEIPTDYLKEILKKLIDTTDRIHKIIYSIKKLSLKAENDPVEEFSISELVDSSLDYCHQRLRALGIRYDGMAVPSDWRSSCRMLQISQVLVNLINNAMDAVSGTVDPWIRIRVEQEPDWTVIKVIDSGRGISEKLLSRLFEPFFTTKAESGGTGLGLSISRNLLEANGGMLEYAETDGHTTFVVKLPNSVQQA